MPDSRKEIEARRYRKSRKKRIAAERAYKQKMKGTKAYQEKERARSRVNKGIKAGKIKKPERCSSCGKRTTKLQFHHTNYRTNSGKWVCTDCNPKGGAAPVKG